MINWIKAIFIKLFKTNSIRNRKITKAKALYYYVIFGSVAGLIYFVASLILDWPWHWSFSQIYLLVTFVLYRFTRKNWKLIWLYIVDMEQGRLLLFLNDYTHFSEEHKMKLIKWVYPGKRQIRVETKSELMNKVMSGGELDKYEKKIVRYKTVFCPQQLKESFSEAMLVNALIYAHNNIQILDVELRKIMNLTDEHILAFDLNKEYEKAKDAKYHKLIERGMKNAEKLKKQTDDIN